MKKTIILFLILFFQKTISQENTIGIATYKTIVIENKDSQLDKMMLEMSPNSNKIISEFSFTLKFDNKKAVFAFDNKLYSDEQAVKFGLLKIKYTSETLQTQDSTFKKFAFGDKNNVIGDTKNKEWTITAESKKINGYLCYKAEQNDIIINSVGTFKHQITAWFCPEIPYSFGPLKFGGLPGLILELQTKDGVFGLEKLIFEKNTTIDVESFKQNQIISNQEMSKIIKERREAMKNQE